MYCYRPVPARAPCAVGRIVGFREHVFTHDVSAVANFFSLQELNFVSATQRALDNPLHVRLEISVYRAVRHLL